FDVYACGQIKTHQGVDSLVGGIDNIHQTLVGADLELVARCLIDVRRTQNVETTDACRQRHRATHDRTSTFGRVDDFRSRLIDQLVIESLQTDADFLLFHEYS